jgi:hypothetical protein
MRCQHLGCTEESLTGHWCQGCIEQEWPQASLDDGQHWIVWKGVWQLTDRLFVGSLGAPYELGEITIPLGLNFCLLSPLGAIKEGHGTHIIAGIVRARDCHLLPQLTLISPYTPFWAIAAFPREKLPDRGLATRLLTQVNEYLPEIEAFERKLRPPLPDKIQLPPSLPHAKRVGDAAYRFYARFAAVCLKRLGPGRNWKELIKPAEILSGWGTFTSQPWLVLGPPSLRGEVASQSLLYALAAADTLSDGDKLIRARELCWQQTKLRQLLMEFEEE